MTNTKKRILIVEGDKSIARLLRETLEDEDHQVVVICVADEPRETMEAAVKYLISTNDPPPDLAIFDGLKDRDEGTIYAFTLSDFLRCLYPMLKIPVILATGDPSILDQWVGPKFKKPFTPMVLLAEVDRLLA